MTSNNTNTKSLSSKWDEYLYSKKYDKSDKSDKSENGLITHTKIGSKELGIYAGSYTITNMPEFWTYYYSHVFENKNKEYLTEKQLIEDGPLLVDIDLRYDTTIKTRQHNKNHIIDLIVLYANKLNLIYTIPNKSTINVYILEKPDVNVCEDKVKDGIHIIFTIKMDKSHQCVLRKMIIEEIENIWDNIQNTNSYEDVFDEGVTKGFVNWQVYGSRKPDHKAYSLAYFYELTYLKQDDETDQEETWDFKEIPVSKINIQQHLPLMSARCKEHQQFELNQSSVLLKKIEYEKQQLNVKQRKPTINVVNTKIDIAMYDFGKISDSNTLDSLIDCFLEEISNSDYEIRETHEFTMILPKSYYGAGSYNKWIRVGWALKNTHEKLFLTWLKLSSQCETFNFTQAKVYELYELWKSFDVKNSDGLTNRSIMFWSKTDNYAEYEKIRKETITYYIEQTLQTMILKDKVAEFDLAVVLYQLFKDQFVCISVKNNEWYEYKNHKWNEIDSGSTLRLLISKKMHDIYSKKSHELIETITKKENNDENTENLKTRALKLGDICILLKTTSWKNNIMKEAKELFYDKNFMNKLDANPYLMCFNNYVIDFEAKTHRKGKPDDYISKSTNIDYIPYDNLSSNTYCPIIQEINKFIDELFPDKELRRYMWEHLASILIGKNHSQTFNIYTGSGCNGKSKLVELMSRCLGDYKATVPITLITQSRNSIGSTSSEVVALMGVRYAVMQEPSKGDVINEGIMKEITGGDPIQARALFKDSVTFMPQFKLVVCTNVLFDINTNDDGTWRRIRICDFMSKFTDAPYENEDKFPKTNFPYQYLIDQKIDEKFTLWAPILMSKLVTMAYQTEGKVKDAKIVTSVSDNYREAQDYLTEFAKEKIGRMRDGVVKKTELMEEFKTWYTMNYGRATLPNGKEITDYMDKQYGKNKRGKWYNVIINYNNESDNEEQIQEQE
jgi:P4 family phage/plasmid primase-like protien